MRIDIITVLPELLESPFAHSIMKRAQEKGLLEVHCHQLRDFAINKHGQVDDYQYGGGAGMVIMCEPLANQIEKLTAERDYDEIIFLTPDGEQYKTLDTLNLIFDALLENRFNRVGGTQAVPIDVRIIASMIASRMSMSSVRSLRTIIGTVFAPALIAAFLRRTPLMIVLRSAAMTIGSSTPRRAIDSSKPSSAVSP